MLQPFISLYRAWDTFAWIIALSETEPVAILTLSTKFSTTGFSKSACLFSASSLYAAASLGPVERNQIHWVLLLNQIHVLARLIMAVFFLPPVTWEQLDWTWHCPLTALLDVVRWLSLWNLSYSLCSPHNPAACMHVPLCVWKLALDLCELKVKRCWKTLNAPCGWLNEHLQAAAACQGEGPPIVHIYTGIYIKG